MADSPREWDFIVKPVPGTRLPSGGWWPPYGHIGHWEVTGKVIEEMGFSAPASHVLCDAARDPDFYDFATVAAHAQTPDEADCCGADSATRSGIIDKAIEDYVGWVDARFEQCTSSLAKGNERLSLYWLGYALHAVEDLAVHQGITNGEHASRKGSDSPDYQAADVAQSYVYARRVLDAVRNAMGQDGFDRLRNHEGDGRLSYREKCSKRVHGHGWDLDNHLGDYAAAGKKYKTLKPAPEPVRWDRESVLSTLVEKILQRRVARLKAAQRSQPLVSASPHRKFEVLRPLTPLAEPAAWTVAVYMAGDDRSPNGIEYAIAQDLAEIKEVGSTDAVHFLVQTDDASGAASYRYRLRKGTDLASDRLARFNGDLNTGSTKTLVDFAQWAFNLFPAERTALVLWGHGSGHDDQDVYRAAGGSVSLRTAARMAQRRLGFFSATRRSILEQGPTRGYGYDDTAGDFLDNVELRKALVQIKQILGRKLDILGFDACLMAMVEVAYQIHDAANVLVASERSEPGDGWWYSYAFRGLARHPEITSSRLARSIVGAYKRAYRNGMTLSAVDLSKIPTVAERIGEWSRAADPASYHNSRRSAVDCGPRSEGYCDLGSFLKAASGTQRKGSKEAKIAQQVFKEAVISSCGGTGGLTLYAPGRFRPRLAGSTDALYLGLNFAKETGWGGFLERACPSSDKAPSSEETLPVPTPVSGLDRFNARHVLAAVRSGTKDGWLDRLRSEVLGPCRDAVVSVATSLNAQALRENEEARAAKRAHAPSPAEGRRILIVPGIMGSLLHDRSGKLGTVWIDPWNLIFGDDFTALRLRWETDGSGAARLGPRPPQPAQPPRIPDADDAVQIEAYRVVPLIYDRMALALMHQFGPVVEFAPFDWRQPTSALGDGLAKRIQALTERHPAMEVAIVAHSMGGLVLADALARLDAASAAAVKGVVVLGVPFLGAASTLQALRAERADLNLAGLLGHKSQADLQNTVQTFRGLFDMMPPDQEELLQPRLFAPGPLSRLRPEDPRFHSPLSLVRDLAPDLQKKTLALVCTTRKTLGAIAVAEDGALDCSGRVPGDGTVSASSALNAGKLLPQSREVNEAHMTLPLDGRAIEHCIGWIGRQFGDASAKASAQPWPCAPEIRIPETREELLRHLEAEDELTLGDFVGMISLAEPAAGRGGRPR